MKDYTAQAIAAHAKHEVTAKELADQGRAQMLDLLPGIIERTLDQLAAKDFPHGVVGDMPEGDQAVFWFLDVSICYLCSNGKLYYRNKFQQPKHIEPRYGYRFDPVEHVHLSHSELSKLLTALPKLGRHPTPESSTLYNW